MTTPETQKGGAAEAAPLVMYPMLYVNEYYDRTEPLTVSHQAHPETPA